MIAGGVVTTPSAPSFELERSLRSLASPGAESRRDIWSDSLALFGSGEDGVITRSGERDDRVLLIDGPLYNLADLRSAAGSGREHPLFTLWDRLGSDSLDRLTGDMTCAFWDGRARRLVLARDPGGYRPLYYWHGPGEFLFASEPRGLFADARVPRDLDDHFLGEWIAILPRPTTATAFAGVHRVPPGHAVIWENDRVRLHRYWRPEALPTLRLKRDADYADLLRETLRQAVDDRLPAAGEVGSQLSGGLDSASVTALAAEILARDGRRLTAFTAVPGKAFVPSGRKDRFEDEGPLAALTAQRYPNIDHVRVANDANPLMRVLERRTAAMDCPVRNPSHVIWLDAIDAAARTRGIKVQLIGNIGNLTISYDGQFAAARMLMQGRLPTLWRLLRDYRRVQGRPWLSLASTTLDPFLPTGVKYGIRRLFGRPGALGLYEHSAINPDFARASGLQARSDRLGGDMRNLFGLDSRALRLSAMDRTDHRSLWRASTRRLYGIDLRDPTCDRRLLDLCLSMPEEQFALGGLPRSLVRRAMADHLPEAVLTERRRGLQAADWPAGLTAARDEIAAEVDRLRHSERARRIIDIDRLDRMIATWPAGDDWKSHEVVWGYLSGLNRAVAVGHFVRRVEGGNG